MTGYDGWQPIGLTSFADTVSAKLDFVKAEGWKSMIKTSQPTDYRRMLRDERKARAARPSSRTVTHTAD